MRALALNNMKTELYMKYGKKIILVTFIAVLVSLVGEFYRSVDTKHVEATNALITSIELRERIGPISSYTLYKVYDYSATRSNAGYREYLFLVIGSKGKGRSMVTVRAEQEMEKPVRYNVVKIQPVD
jgi:hypothetical protein